MSHRAIGRQAISTLATALLLLAAVVAGGLAAEEEHPLVGRWVIEAEPGGAVWAFRPDGALIITGPGDIISMGTWTPAEGVGEFDARVDVEVSGQALEILGQVATEAEAIALYVVATEATRPEDWTPWPAASRLVGHPLGMMVAETPAPTEPPLDCLRPRWMGDTVDWNRCDEVAGAG